MPFDFKETNINGIGSLKVFIWSGTSQDLIDSPIPARFVNSENQVFTARCTDGTFQFEVNSDATGVALMPHTTYHFGAYTLGSITLGMDSTAPTYLTGVSLFPSSSEEFEEIIAQDGTEWVRNNSSKTLTMQGSATYQLSQGAGGKAKINIWSERSTDNGLTHEVNQGSLRTSEVPNNSSNSQSKSAGIVGWEPGVCVRWAMYNSGPGAITLDSPTDTVNGDEPIEGFSFYWQLNEI